MSAAALTSSTDVSLILAIRGEPPSRSELRHVGQSKPVRHARDEVDDLLGLLPTLRELIEDPPHSRVGSLVLEACVTTEIDTLEHEFPECEHRVADLLALYDVTGLPRALDEIVHECIDPPRATIAEERDLRLGQLIGVEDAEAHRVV